MTRRGRWVAGLLLAAGAAVLAAAFVLRQPAPARAPTAAPASQAIELTPADVARAERAELVRRLDISGSLKAVNSAVVKARIAAVVQKLDVREGDTADRALLDSLHIHEYNHVIVLAYSTLEPQQADAKTLVTLLHLRDMAGRDATPFSIVSEMLDLRNRELAEAAKVDDFIVSEHLISLMMTQLSENAELLGVFTDMFDPEGAEIYLKPVADYVKPGQPVNFYTVTEAARRRGETALGYRSMSESRDAEKAYGVHTNPKKSERTSFSAEDKIIVIAEG
ncbi:MAG TPA: hypothetical protein VLM87_00575 [Rubrivivax sp.]|nr:hypothetical protein [Rubrivivax sp.]